MSVLYAHKNLYPVVSLPFLWPVCRGRMPFSAGIFARLCRYPIAKQLWDTKVAKEIGHLKRLLAQAEKTQQSFAAEVSRRQSGTSQALTEKTGDLLELEAEQEEVLNEQHRSAEEQRDRISRCKLKRGVTLGALLLGHAVKRIQTELQTFSMLALRSNLMTENDILHLAIQMLPKFVPFAWKDLDAARQANLLKNEYLHLVEPTRLHLTNLRDMYCLHRLDTEERTRRVAEFYETSYDRQRGLTALQCLLRSHSRRLKSDAFSLLRYYSWAVRAVEDERAACSATIKRVQETEKLKRADAGASYENDSSARILPVRLRGSYPRACERAGSHTDSYTVEHRESSGARLPVEACSCHEQRCAATLLDAPMASLKKASSKNRLVPSSSVAYDRPGIFIRRRASGQPIGHSSACGSRKPQPPRRSHTSPSPVRRLPWRSPPRSPTVADDGNISDPICQLTSRFHEPQTEEAPCVTPVCHTARRHAKTESGAEDFPVGSSYATGNCCSPCETPQMCIKSVRTSRGRRGGGAFSVDASPAGSLDSVRNRRAHGHSFGGCTRDFGYCESETGASSSIAGSLESDGLSGRGGGSAERAAARLSKSSEREAHLFRHSSSENRGVSIGACSEGGAPTTVSQGDFDLTLNATQASPFFSNTALQVAAYVAKPAEESDYLPNGLPRPRPLDPSAPLEHLRPSQGFPTDGKECVAHSLRLLPPQPPCPPVTITYKSEKQSIWEEPRPEEEKIRARVHVVGRGWPPPRLEHLLPS
ncbi:hypothetical protein BESB_001790 [Besnoitia besnoiti]|uniref:Uncharacterized protein n=1 Tax=Besnoitia besnoiti TaxID=94643 RepID=A0A2A9MP98_BESBE|nr:hypothetical protein BESB_001790 [Besnoitia besnoiti]PFH37837.1 hypothetical protein BESB_001790 [Besnoitia besnoiti]